MHLPKSELLKPGNAYCAELFEDEWPAPAIIVHPPARKWFLATVVLIGTAITAEMISKRFASINILTMARSHQAMNNAKQYAALGMTAMAKIRADESARLKQVVSQNSYRMVGWGLAGIGLCLLAAGCWGVSHARGERASSALLFLLFSFYAFLQILMV
jgi:hypothetical protein